MVEYYNSSSNLPMARTTTARIMRESIYTFLKNFQHFTSTPALLALPYAVSTLVSNSLISSSYVFPLVHGRLKSLFLASGFPASSELFSVLNLKLSQTILTFFFVLPFTYSFLLPSKVVVIRTLFSSSRHDQHEAGNRILSWIRVYVPLVITHLCNSLLILSANATCFCLVVLFFNVSELFLGLSSQKYLLLLSAIGAVTYSIVLANAYAVCNLSLIVSGADKKGGLDSILKVCVMIKGRIGIALSLLVTVNMALAGVEALFQYRVMRAYDNTAAIDLFMVLEGLFIAYLYGTLLVLDTIAGSLFLKRCKIREFHDHEDASSSCLMEIEERDDHVKY